jgi:hypothetical protein
MQGYIVEGQFWCASHARVSASDIAEGYARASVDGDSGECLGCSSMPARADQWTIRESCDGCGRVRCAARTNADGTEARLCDDSALLEMVASYAETALWSSAEFDEGGNMGAALDDTYGADDIDSDAFAEMISDCESFRDCHADLLGDVDPWAAGHNLWLARNGHGSGFFDSDAEHADELQRAAKPYGPVGLYADGGKVHAS